MLKIIYYLFIPINFESLLGSILYEPYEIQKFTVLKFLYEIPAE